LRQIAGVRLVVPATQLLHTATCVVARLSNLPRATDEIERVAKHIVGKCTNDMYGPRRSVPMLAHLLQTTLTQGVRQRHIKEGVRSALAEGRIFRLTDVMFDRGIDEI